MGKRKLPPSEIISSCKYDEPLPRNKETWPHKQGTGMASELNAQRQRPVYDEFKKRRDYKP